MKIQLAPEAIIHFEKTGMIEFHGLVQHTQLVSLVRALDREIEHRVEQHLHKEMQFSSKVLPKISLNRRQISDRLLVDEGRDVALASSQVAAILRSRKFVETASLLLHQKPLRWGFDHLCSESAFLIAFENREALQKSLSITGVQIGVAIFLPDIYGKKGEEPASFDSKVLFFRPYPLETSVDTKSGSGSSIQKSSFFHLLQEHSSSVVEHTQAPSSRVLVFGFTDMRPVYIHNPLDTATHHLKQYSYGFGDRVKETTHPIVCRSRS